MPEFREIQHICGLLEHCQIDKRQFLEQFTRALTRLTGCSRACVRLFVHTPEGRALRCLAMYDRHVDRLVAAPDVVKIDRGPYVDALEAEGCVIAPDARTHPVTRLLADDYLLPADIHSVLDIGFSVNGVLLGTFSCEQTGSPRNWTQRHIQLLRQVGSRASLVLHNAIDMPSVIAPPATTRPWAALLQQPLHLIRSRRASDTLNAA